MPYSTLATGMSLVHLARVPARSNRNANRAEGRTEFQELVENDDGGASRLNHLL